MAAVWIAGAARVGAQPGTEGYAVRITLVGDSTVTDDSGWGRGLKSHLDHRGLCTNLARNGRSSKSYRAEGHWTEAIWSRPDYVLIQFGHNDQPGKGPERETDPATTFREHLARYVDEARAAGAKPVLVTSLTRRLFGADGRIHSDLGPYVEATRAIAAATDTPLIDLNARSIEALEAMGPEAAARLDHPDAAGGTDRTHLDDDGSSLFGGLVARELRRVVPELAAYVSTDAATEVARVAWSRCLDQPADWYGAPEAVRIADNVLLYQRRTGGWPKNIEMARPLAAEERTSVAAESAFTDSTIDNGATYTQLRYLARVFGATGADRFRAAFFRGLDYLFRAQYANGGWPQFFPLRDDYSRHVTFNDDAMAGVLAILRDVSAAAPPFTFVDGRRRARARAAVVHGTRLILAAQVRLDGRPTAWCAQHDARTLEPRGARTYEHPSLSGRESVGIVEFLMSLEAPSTAVVAAVEGAVAWFRSAAIERRRVERRVGRSVEGGYDVVAVDDPTAPPVWARFYDLKTGRPIFSGRDGIVRYSLAEIERERRVGYSWLGPYAADLLSREYPAWAARVGVSPPTALPVRLR